MLASVALPAEEKSVDHVEMRVSPRSFEYSAAGELSLAAYSRYLENTRIRLIINSNALMDLLNGHPERIFAVRSQHWEAIGEPVRWIGDSEIICDAAIGYASQRSIILSTGLRLEEAHSVVQGYAILVCIDVQQRKAVSIPEETQRRLNASARLSQPPSPFVLPAVPLGEAGVVSNSFAVRHSDLDSNRHVNQAVYLAWLTDLIALARHGGVRVTEAEQEMLGRPYKGLTILYQAEVHFPAKVTVAMRVRGSAAHFTIYAEGGRGSYEAIRAQIMFRANDASL